MPPFAGGTTLRRSATAEAMRSGEAPSKKRANAWLVGDINSEKRKNKLMINSSLRDPYRAGRLL